MNYYFLLPIVGLIVVLFTTPLFIAVAKFTGLVDNPTGGRKIHQRPTPLAGGYVFYFLFVVGFFLFSFLPKGIGWVGFGDSMLIVSCLTILMLGGYIDDRYNLKSYYQVIFPVVASLVAVVFGLTDNFIVISSPFGGEASLLFGYFGITLANVVSFVWVMCVVYTFKLLDGVDALVGALSGVCFFVFFLLSLLPFVGQYGLAFFCLYLFFGTVGYLYFAKFPAKTFLGEGGSVMLGFLIAVLSIVLGGKIATALLVMAMPIFDLFYVVLRRISSGKSPFVADRLHLHHRLLDIGWSQNKIVVFMATSGLLVGCLSLVFQTVGKTYLLVFVFFAIASFVLWVEKFDSKKNKTYNKYE